MSGTKIKCIWFYRFQMASQKSLVCEKCGGPASVLCTACNLCACLDCITLIHEVPIHNPIIFIHKTIHNQVLHLQSNYLIILWIHPKYTNPTGHRWWNQSFHAALSKAHRWSNNQYSWRGNTNSGKQNISKMSQKGLIMYCSATVKGRGQILLCGFCP